MKTKNLGSKIIAEIVKQAMCRVKHPDPDANHVFVWSAGCEEQLEAVVEAAYTDCIADSRRLSWLEEQNGRIQFESEDEASVPTAVVYVPTLDGGHGAWREAGRGDDFREAIDAAMLG